MFSQEIYIKLGTFLFKEINFIYIVRDIKTVKALVKCLHYITVLDDDCDCGMFEVWLVCLDRRDRGEEGVMCLETKLKLYN